MWKATQKVYNGFENCWDCCSLFGNSSGEAELDSDNNHKDIYLMVNSQPPPTAPDQSAPDISMFPCDQQTTSSTQQSTPDASISYLVL